MHIKGKSSLVIGIDLHESLRFLKLQLRSVEEYRKVDGSQQRIWQEVKDIISLIALPAYVCIGDNFSEPRSAVRSYKGLLWDTSVLKSMSHVSIEVNVSETRTKRMAIVEISSCDISHCDDIALDSMYSFILISDDSINDVASICSSLIHHDDCIGFDISKLFALLNREDGRFIVRYGVANNGENEHLVVVANKNTLTDAVILKLESLKLSPD